MAQSELEFFSNEFNGVYEKDNKIISLLEQILAILKENNDKNK